jgi:hypothetical protein
MNENRRSRQPLEYKVNATLLNLDFQTASKELSDHLYQDACHSLLVRPGRRVRLEAPDGHCRTQPVPASPQHVQRGLVQDLQPLAAAVPAKLAAGGEQGGRKRGRKVQGQICSTSL